MLSNAAQNTFVFLNCPILITPTLKLTKETFYWPVNNFVQNFYYFVQNAHNCTNQQLESLHPFLLAIQATKSFYQLIPPKNKKVFFLFQIEFLFIFCCDKTLIWSHSASQWGRNFGNRGKISLGNCHESSIENMISFI